MRGAWAIIAVAFVCASGCAQKDWIDRTLVTVDVTGTWEGTFKRSDGGADAGDVVFVLQQQGAKVTGQIKFASGAQSGPVKMSSEGLGIEGAVNGDTFTFHTVTGPGGHGEFQVNGEEMVGSMTRLTTQAATL